MAMFLHSGASLHGHEYSTSPPNRLQKRVPFLRSALRPMTDNDTNGGYPTPPPHGSNPSLSTPHQTPSKNPRPQSYSAIPPLPSPDSQNLPARARPNSDFFPRRDHGVRFAEADEPEGSPSTARPLDQYRESPSPERGWTGHSEDESAYSEASDGETSLTSVPRKRKRRAPRSGTRYLVAQPPSHAVKRHRRFIHLKPALLLQLQQLTDTRPKPAFDVLPASVLRKGAPRLTGRFPRPFGARHELGSDDLILARSEDYDSTTPDDSSDELGNRELVAVISSRSNADGRTDIVLGDGTIWTATAMSNGSYEFTTMRSDGSVITARWVKRKVPLEDEDNYKYTFSVIDPSSRRHPIMGTLTPSTLEVLDNYTTVSPHSSKRHPPTRPFSTDTNGSVTERTTLPVDDRTRTFITATGVAIALVKLGIAGAPKAPYLSTQKAPAAPASTPANGSANHTRKVSLPVSHPTLRHSTAPVIQEPVTSPTNGHASSDVKRRWTVSGKRRSDVGSPSGNRRSDMGLAAPTETEEMLGLDEGAEKEKEGKRRLYSKIKRALGIGRD